ncbi:membrane protein [Paenibacillus baekrokdamisoli]|uniref:Membrane protein n=1 Tax=Paenibacillus baekrokdamisoli TaxID=1712516 RepID=A0A3G9J4D1_9BACL|nr:DoxX-like family protein [Paenibacillus baekrokdamisoli]MBB3069999.1 hypothetical protein [Paenibacillus baekrokdamisoli]BBH20651.1 membrane protein [Paenibacillus baekrokdamisoli]
MRSKPIYVEIDMMTDLEKLWTYTQTPKLHEQWDLRFSEITYLPREKGDDDQHFLYRTRIGFGLAIAGTGVSKATNPSSKEERTSTLSFGSEQAISLISKGGGYWKYRTNGDMVTFVTQYNYQTRFGLLGRWLDRLLFRPLFGYATAWSFDMLRIWLEKSIPPIVSLQRAVIHYFSVGMLTLLWLFEGIVPKLLYPQAGELAIVQQTGWFAGWEGQVLQLLGYGEIIFGLTAALLHRRKELYGLQIILLFALTMAAFIRNPELLLAPFNPLTLSVPMIGFCLLAGWSSRDLPKAGRCKRKM